MSKQYKGWEIIKGLSEGKFKEGDKFLGVLGIEFEVCKYENGNYYLKDKNGEVGKIHEEITDNNINFTKVKEPITFMEAVESNKYIKIIDEDIVKRVRNFKEEEIEDNKYGLEFIFSRFLDGKYLSLYEIVTILGLVFYSSSLREILTTKKIFEIED